MKNEVRQVNESVPLEAKANTLRLALAMVGVNVNNPMAEMIITMLGVVEEKGAGLSVSDAMKIQMAINEKYPVQAGMPNP